IPVSGSVTANTGLSQPLTDTQLRANAVPVSMTAVPPGLAYLSTATITRSANTTAYTANDVYGNGSGGNAFELTNIAPSGGFVFLSSLDIIFNITALPSGMSAFAVYLFNAPPSSAITDNLPYSLSSGDRASIITLNGFSLNASLARGGALNKYTAKAPMPDGSAVILKMISKLLKKTNPTLQPIQQTIFMEMAQVETHLSLLI
ncbi:MAG: hypothetical protein ACKPEQ_39445, partial [Dolichospermum sp.]